MKAVRRFLNCWWLFLRTGMHYDTDNDIMVYILIATIYTPITVLSVSTLLIGQSLGWW